MGRRVRGLLHCVLGPSHPFGIVAIAFKEATVGSLAEEEKATLLAAGMDKFMPWEIPAGRKGRG